MDHFATPDGLPRDALELGSLLASKARPGRMVGLELEVGVLDAETLTPVTHEGPRGIGAFLERLQRTRWPEPTHEGEALIGLCGPGSERITIEPGGQVELSTRPTADLAPMLANGVDRVRLMSSVARELGLVIVGGGLLPAAQQAVHWMPKGRYTIMRDYFAGLGEAGHLGHVMMQRTLSLQVSLDYTSRDDAKELLQLAFRAAPLATAIWAASPYTWAEGEEGASWQSYRAEAWRFTDPHRQGLVASQLSGPSLAGYAEHALAAPMMFRIERGEGHEAYVPMKGASFAHQLARGHWEDGTSLAEQDVWDHLGSIFTDARIKPSLLELRSTDGPVPGAVKVCGKGPLADKLLVSLGEVPAFWVGLCYDATARAAALESLRSISDAELQRAHAEVPRKGLATAWGSRSVVDAARELIEIARGGLRRRAEQEIERPWVADLLDGVRCRLERGRSPSHDLIEAHQRAGRAAVIEALQLK